MSRIRVVVIDGAKECTKCRLWLPLDGFHRNRVRSSGRDSWCKRCSTEKMRQWRAKYPEKARIAESRNPDRRRQRARFRGSHWTHERWELVLTAQGGLCAVSGCGRQASHADHDHNTGAARGALCPQCNSAEGLIKTPERAFGLLEYIQTWKDACASKSN